ncbi:hypothetical protein [Streptomyces sp. NPDC048438]
MSQGHGVWRHPLRYERLRLDATETDVPPLDLLHLGATDEDAPLLHGPP